MTDKKKRTLAAALSLFASEGYNAVSTNRIARTAKVSEGLIFRHFKNKKGLLDAIMKESEQKLQQVLASILASSDTLEVIRLTIEFPLSIPKKEYDYWRLQFKLKWEKAYNHTHKMLPLVEKLTWAFSELGYSHPEHEAKSLVHLLEGIATEVLRDNLLEQEAYCEFLLQKYLP
ncbi:MAG: TetR/AcrR family transcriptional regulator [Bacteroidota bacterium]